MGQQLIEQMRTRIQSGLPYDYVLQSGIDNPDKVRDILTLIMQTSIPHSSAFDALISFLPEADFPEMLALSLMHLKNDPKHQLASNFIAMTALQQGALLKPHLDELWDIHNEHRIYYWEYAWRDAGVESLNLLKKQIWNATQSNRLRWDAYTRVMETRLPQAFNFAAPLYPVIFNRPAEEFEYYLYQVGYKQCGDEYQQLYENSAQHICFPLDYRTQNNQPYHLQTHHPTWNLEAQDTRHYPFGGALDIPCEACGGYLTRILFLNPIPSQMQISTLPFLTLGACLTCVTRNHSFHFHFYRHDNEGFPHPLQTEPFHIAEKERLTELMPVEVMLSNSDNRWRWQEWGLSNGRENLHRIGGHPTWINGAQYPDCPHCEQTMRFLMQLDDHIVMFADGNQMGGIGSTYIHWCDDCHISAYQIQCT